MRSVFLRVIRAGLLVFWTAAAVARPVVDLDGMWGFRMDPSNAGEADEWFGGAVAFPDTIEVPGAWEAQGFGGETAKLKHHFIGKGWYKREVEVPPDWAGRRVFLCFGGVHRYAAVWVNGKAFGEHIGCLSPFELDITECARPGTTAVIAVRVDSEQRWDIDTMIGAWDIIDYMDTYWGGLWGHVRLEARGDAFLEDLCVEPRIDAPRCLVSATIRGNAPSGARLRLDILDKEGNSVCRADASPETPLDGVLAEVPGAKLWTPDTPNLYWARLSLVCDGECLDEIETRFGFREIAIDGVRFLLNGVPLFLRGYGDDAIYPETMAAPSDEGVYRKKIALAKEHGFNHVRHHSHFLPPEYYDVCDELGMLVSPELPIGYQQFYNRAQEAALKLYKTEWEAAIRRFRNHPSIFDWCMGNEMYESIPIAPELYGIAKQLDTTRPVVDTDGVFPAGFMDGTRDRDTLDFYFMQFDVFNTPLDNPDLYHCPSPKKPVVSHETGNFVTFPRLDQIELFRDNFKPFWLVEAREKVRVMGLLEETPRWAENTERLYTLLHKVNIEAIRKNANLSGYHWWLFQDYWTTSNGIIDTYFRKKPGVDSGMIREYNNDVVLLEEGLQGTYRGGESLGTALLVSNFGGDELAGGLLSYVVEGPGGILAQGAQAVNPAAQGEVTALAQVETLLPEVAAPVKITLKVMLASGGRMITNHWTTWLYPAGVVSAPAPLYVAAELLPWLASYGAQPIPAQPPYPSGAVYVSGELTPALLDAALSGASLILYKPAGFLPSAPTRFKSAWWLGSPSDNNAGTVVYDHPATRAMAPEGWCDTAWYRLIENSDGYVFDGLAIAPKVIIRGVETACVCRNKGLLFEARAGQGVVVVCGLNLDAVLSDGRLCPAAQWLVGSLIAYGASFPDAGGELSEAFLRERAVESPVFAPPFVEGFGKLVRNDGETSSWFTYRKQADNTEILRQDEAGRSLEWETAVVSENVVEDGVTIVFAGGLGWLSQPEAGGFSLAVNGKEAVRFDVTIKRRVWRGETPGVLLSFSPKRITSEDAAGLFYLGVPRRLVVPGQTVRLSVSALGGGSKRWFALHPYTDTLGLTHQK